MKKLHIVALLAVAAAIGIIVSTTDSASQYVTFQEAKAMAQDGQDSKIHVVGELKKDASGKVVGIEYNPSKDPNFLAFSLVDNNGKEQRVVCYTPPASMRDFDKSEKVVVIGRYQAGQEQFLASEILMKCPSKYEEKNI